MCRFTIVAVPFLLSCLGAFAQPTLHETSVHSCNGCSSSTGNAVNIRCFGAQGDGISDDTEAIQAAINQLRDGRRTLLLPPGRYVADDIVVPDSTLVYGNGACVVGRAGSESDILILGSECKLVGLEIDGNRDEKPLGRLIYSEYAENLVIRDCHFHDAPGHAVHIKFAKDLAILSNQFNDITHTAIQIEDSEGGLVHGNRSSAVGEYHCKLWGGDATEDGPLRIKDITVSQNVCDGGDAGIWATRGIRIKFIGNTIRNVGLEGLDLERSEQCSVIGNSVLRAGTAALTSFFGTKNTIFANNTVELNDQTERGAGIEIHGGAHNLVVSGNTFHNPGPGYRNGVIVHGSNRHHLIQGNQLYNCGIRMHDSYYLSVVENVVSMDQSIDGSAILNRGSVGTVISRNRLIRSDDPGMRPEFAAILLDWVDSQWSSQNCQVEGNYILGWVYSITDFCSENAVSLNDITRNRVDGQIVVPSGFWGGRAKDNNAVEDPNRVVFVTEY